MRGSHARLVTWIAVVLVVAVAVAAAVDAVRARGGESPRKRAAAPALAPQLAAVAEDLRGAGVEGSLVYVDERCRLHVLALPTLSGVDGGESRDCRLSPTFAPPRALPISATTSAVRRDGSVAFVRAGDVVVWPFGCIEAGGVRCSRAVLPHVAVERALAPSRDATVSIDNVAFLGDTHLATVVRIHSRARAARTVVAVFERRRLVGTFPWFRARATRFYVSPSGDSFAVATSGPNRFFLLDRRARPGALADVARNWFGRTSLSGARAVAWSPDERWTALAKNESVYLFTTRDTEPFLVRLPIQARDVAWRS